MASLNRPNELVSRCSHARKHVLENLFLDTNFFREDRSAYIYTICTDIKSSLKVKGQTQAMCGTLNTKLYSNLN